MPKPWNKKGPLLAILSRPRYETVFYRGFLGTQSAPTSLYSIEKIGSTTPAPALYRFFDLVIQSFTRKISSRPASPRCFCHCLCKAPNVAPCNSRAKAGCYIGTWSQRLHLRSGNKCVRATRPNGGWLFWTTFARSLRNASMSRIASVEKGKMSDSFSRNRLAIVTIALVDC